MNKVFLIGNLTKDPKYVEFEKGGVCNMDIAVSREYGEGETDFFPIKVFGTQGENCNKYLVKGSKIAVEGRIENRSYMDKEGQKRMVTEIIAYHVEFLYTKTREEREEERTNQSPSQISLEEIDDNNLPF